MINKSYFVCQTIKDLFLFLKKRFLFSFFINSFFDFWETFKEGQPKAKSQLLHTLSFLFALTFNLVFGLR